MNIEINGVVVAKVDLEKKLEFLYKELYKQEAQKDRLHKAGMKLEQPDRAEIFQQAVPHLKAVSQLRAEIMKIEKALGG